LLSIFFIYFVALRTSKASSKNPKRDKPNNYDSNTVYRIPFACYDNIRRLSIHGMAC